MPIVRALSRLTSSIDIAFAIAKLAGRNLDQIDYTVEPAPVAARR